MSNYDAERTNINGKWYRYQAEIFKDIHTTVGKFKHRTEMGGYLKTWLIVKINKLTGWYWL